MKKIRLLTCILILISNSLYSQILDSCFAIFCYTATLDTNNNLNVTFQNFSTSGFPMNFSNWDFGDSSAYSVLENPTHIYSDSGSYIVTLIIGDEFGCVDVLIDTISVGSNCDTTTNLTSEISNNKFAIYPSIVSSKFQVVTGGLIKSNLKFCLYDLLGKIILESVLLDQNTEFCRNKIKSGIYFYNILNEDRVVKSGKLIFD